MDSVSNLRKPAGVSSVTIACRPLEPVKGGFLLELSLEVILPFKRFGGAKPQFSGQLTWCGSRSLIGFAASTFSTMLRLPLNLRPGDCFPITIELSQELSVTAKVLAPDGNQAAIFDFEATFDAPPPEFVCADPAVIESRTWRDPIASGPCGVPRSNVAPFQAVAPLRPLPDGANLAIQLQHAGGATAGIPLQIITVVGQMRRLAIIAANSPSVSVQFPLDAASVDAKWPISLISAGAVEWSASIYRGIDVDFRPAFTLVDV